MSPDQIRWGECLDARVSRLNRPEKASRMILGIALVRYLRSVCPDNEVKAIIDGLDDEPGFTEVTE